MKLFNKRGRSGSSLRLKPWAKRWCLPYSVLLIGFKMPLRMNWKLLLKDLTFYVFYML